MPQAQTLDIRIQTSDKKGFTLVELMVAVSIIGILAAVGVVIYSGSTRDAQNTKRVQDLVAISHALELYKSLHGHYPNTPVIGTFQRVDNAIGVSPPASATNALVPQFMAQMPCDPVSGFCYQYISNATGTEYKITTDAGLPASGRINVANLRKQANLIDPASYVGYVVTDPCVADHPGTPRGFAIFTPGGCTFTNVYTSY